VPVLLRLAAGSVVGEAGKFGLDEPDLVEAARAAVRSPFLELLGVHAFGASNVRDADRVADHVAATLAAARRLVAATGVRLRLVDIGGGLGIPYRDDEAPLDLDRLRARLTELAGGWATDPDLAGASMLVEPGRYLAGPMGRYVSTVLEVKRVGGRTYAIVDGGVHHLVRPVLLGEPHRLELVRVTETEDGRVGEGVVVGGPLCTGIDVLGELPPGPPPQPGDLVAVRDTGAYGFTESMPLFLSHPTAAEVAVRGDEAQLVRERIEPATWLAGQRRFEPPATAAPAAPAGTAAAPASARQAG
jgi:diaminopimelate decarboxylase